MTAVIKDVLNDSIAKDCGLAKGDVLNKINGILITDILEYKFYSSSEYLELEVQKKDGTLQIIEVENEEFEDLGIIFENPFIDKTRHCHNKCIFCFIDQLPPNMRETMYFKDDDYRLSSFLGNYITLTNVTEEEIDKIIDMHLPRINVSVHTTDPALRCMMLNNKNAGNILIRLQKLADANISLNAQIVLCPNINDGPRLDQTLQDLSGLYPAIKSISVVPVGLTKYRNTLPKLQKFDTISSINVIKQISSWQGKFLKKFGTRLVYVADEFYISTKTPIPPYDFYEDYLQIENGVGLVRVLLTEFEDALKDMKTGLNISPKSLVTGFLAKDILKSLAEKVDKNIKVFPIINEFFGHDITVAGLITGNDLIDQLKGKNLGKYLLIPSVMLRDNTFLDDITIYDIQEKLRVKVVIVQNNGYDLLQKLVL